MRCSDCQFDNPDDARFCGECGAKLALVCAACGAAATPGQKFCHGCGHRLGDAAPAQAAAAPDAYTPRHLAERILESRSAIEGERKQVSVLFADVTGSTPR